MLITDWRPNNGAHFDTHTFAIGDVHGQAETLGTLLTHLEGLPRAARGTGPDRELVFLGDLIDRGPDSLGAVRLAFEARDRFEHVVLLPGNHELMLLDGISGNTDTMLLWFGNGGMDFLEEVDPAGDVKLGGIAEAMRAALPDDWAQIYGAGPTHHLGGRNRDVLFVHAGIDPKTPLEETFRRGRFDRGDTHWAWMRHPFLSWEGGWAHLGLTLVVHGHTPATTKPIADQDEALQLLDCVDRHACINLDAGAMRRGQVAAVEFAGDAHRLHIAEAPALDL